MILRTDLAPTVWRGADGLTVQVRGFADVLPRQGVALRLLAQNNDVLAEAVTGADGAGRFAAPLLHGEGAVAPRAVEAMAGDDYTVLDLDAAAFDLSDRGVAGLPHPGPLDAFVWLDRGIYRPGETANVMALLRDDAGRPADIPARFIIRRPNGQTFLEATPARTAGAALYLPALRAAPGRWKSGRTRRHRRSAKHPSASMLSCPTAWRWSWVRLPANWCPVRQRRCRWPRASCMGRPAPG
jgi:hypothetical protein